MQPQWQNCPGGPPCGNFYWVKTNYDTAGYTGNQDVNGSTGAIASVGGKDSTGTQTTGVAHGGLVTISTWEPFANGGKGGVVSLPAGQKTTTDGATGKSFVTNIPSPTAVPQSGWVVLPGPFWAWFGSNEGVLELNNSGNDYVVAALSASGGLQLTWHLVNQSGQVVQWTSAISYAEGSAAATSGAQLLPDGGFTPQGTALLQVGSALMTLGTALLAGGILGGNAPAAALGALSFVLGGIVTWEATKYTYAVEEPAVDWMYADDDFGGGIGCSIAGASGTRGVRPLCQSGSDGDGDYW